MENITKSTVIRPAVALALAFSLTQASLLGLGGSGTGEAPATPAAVHVEQTDAIVGGQSSEVELLVCAALIAASIVAPGAIFLAVPYCYDVLTGTAG